MASTKVKTDTPTNGVAKEVTAFSKEQYLIWYEDMLLMRRFEERAGQLYG